MNLVYELKCFQFYIYCLSIYCFGISKIIVCLITLLFITVFPLFISLQLINYQFYCSAIYQSRLVTLKIGSAGGRTLMK